MNIFLYDKTFEGLLTSSVIADLLRGEIFLKTLFLHLFITGFNSSLSFFFELFFFFFSCHLNPPLFYFIVNELINKCYDKCKEYCYDKEVCPSHCR